MPLLVALIAVAIVLGIASAIVIRFLRQDRKIRRMQRATADRAARALDRHRDIARP